MRQLLGVKLAVARACGLLARARGGGTSLPGKLLIRMEPKAISALVGRLPRGSVLISATNGKTTTAALAASIFEQTGISLVHNQAGANMAGGIASTLLSAARPHAGIDGQLGLFEVDEFWLDRLLPQLSPRVVLLGNLFRDQLDRYGELDAIAERWARSLATPAGRRARLACNADDPLLADIARLHGARPGDDGGDIPRSGDGGGDMARPGEDGGDVGRPGEDGGDVGRPGEDGGDVGRPGGGGDNVFFGIEDDTLALPGLAHAADAKHCRRCGSPYRFDAIYLGHLGRYHCPTCGQTRPSPTVIGSEVRLDGVRGARFTLTTPAGSSPVDLALPGLYNVYNALAAAALGVALDVPLTAIVDGLQRTTAAFGRAEAVTIAGRPARILLIKNPAGANEVLRTLALEDGEHELLGVLNDLTADGHDVSWIWDADFELLAGRVRRAVCSGTRGAELALRLKYAGVPTSCIEVIEQLDRALAAASDSAAPAQSLYILPTYTAMLALRELLVRRGEARSSWQ